MKKRVLKKMCLRRAYPYGRKMFEKEKTRKIYLDPEKWSGHVWIFWLSEDGMDTCHWGLDKEVAIDYVYNGFDLSSDFMITDLNLHVLAEVGSGWWTGRRYIRYAPEYRLWHIGGRYIDLKTKQAWDDSLTYFVN